MLGTIVNFFAIIAGGLIGILLKKGLSKRFEEALMKMVGLSVTIIGLNGVIGAMFKVDLATGKLSDSGSILMLLSLIFGCIIGEAIDIDSRLNGLGQLIDSKTKNGGFSQGFIPATLVFAIGAMAIIGALNDGLRGDSSILFAKSTIDFITSIILASTLGIGVCFSAIPVALWQGGIALCAGFIAPFISDAMLGSICMVGYIMIMCIGFNFVFNTKIRIANMLPALIFPILYHTVWLNYFPG